MSEHRLTSERIMGLIAGVPVERLNMIAQMVWDAYAKGELTDAQAQLLGAAIERRRGSMPWQRAGAEAITGEPPVERKALPPQERGTEVVSLQHALNLRRKRRELHSGTAVRGPFIR